MGLAIVVTLALRVVVAAAVAVILFFAAAVDSMNGPPIGHLCDAALCAKG